MKNQSKKRIGTFKDLLKQHIKQAQERLKQKNTAPIIGRDQKNMNPIIVNFQEDKIQDKEIYIQTQNQKRKSHSNNCCLELFYQVFKNVNSIGDQAFQMNLSRQKKTRYIESVQKKKDPVDTDRMLKIESQTALKENKPINRSYNKIDHTFLFQKNYPKLPSIKQISSTYPSSLHPEQKLNQQQFIKWIRQNINGFNTNYISNIGLPVQTLYVDHTATSRPFQLVEVLIRHAKLFAANPHTQFSKFGKFSTQLMHYSRDSLLESFSAPKDQYTVLPTGGGSTGAIQKAILLLNKLQKSDQNWKNPCIYLTPYQHHSNLLPWVQFYQKTQCLPHDKNGTLLMQQIYKQLSSIPSPNIIVTISAASNVTSKLTDLKSFNELIKNLRRQTDKKIVFAVDCAAFCCHKELNLLIYDQIDFAFISPHKNLGGAESCGILLGRKSLMSSNVPTFPGGGTVRFVHGYSQDKVLFEQDAFSKQIAGTPPYLGFYRAALSFELLKNEKTNTELFFQGINAINQQMRANGVDTVINIYGESQLNLRANVVSFNLCYQEYNFVHNSFVSVILSDIFGIQVRSGCFCAGPFGLLLQKVNSKIAKGMRQEVELGVLKNKPGYLRLDLTFYLEKFQVQYIVNSLKIIALNWRNLQNIYTVCNNGEVVYPSVFQKYKQTQIYELWKANEAYKKWQDENSQNHQKLQNRAQTLQKQLKVGQKISKNPEKYLKSAKNGQIHKFTQQ